MKTLMALGVFGAAFAAAGAELKSGPTMPYRVVADWARLPQGWTFGPCSTVADRDPLLVRWQYGLGRAAVFTSDAKNRWAEK